MKQYLKRIEVLSAIFLTFIAIFTELYSYYLSPVDSFYCAVSFQTFTGTSMVEKEKELKIISSMQMIISYFIVAIIIYSVLF